MPLDPKQLAAIREASTEPALRAARDLLLAEVERLAREGSVLRWALRAVSATDDMTEAKSIVRAALAPDAAKEGGT
jgi:hypothetical protein